MGNPMEAVTYGEALALDKAAALTFVREHGFEGDELPCGDASGYRCPIARALDASYAYRSRVLLKSGEYIDYPVPVKRFVAAFDARQYPDLEASR